MRRRDRTVEMREVFMVVVGWEELDEGMRGGDGLSWLPLHRKRRMGCLL